ncbi:MAG TPA: DNA topoisomerase IB [Bryobacteraceae bacterium]
MKAVALSPKDPYESARFIGLQYVQHAGRGITRRRAGRGFVYLGEDGRIVKDAAVLERIRSLVIPPAWSGVWICPIPQGHLQAVGRDARGRKQYRYHPLYRQVREHTKFERMVPFANLLPLIRKRVSRDLKLPGYPKNKVIAAIVRLLETSCIRVGNEDYVRENGSFGLTTLRNKHVRVRGSKILFHFKGKSGQVHDIELEDPKLARIISKCQCIPGQELFQYVDNDGQTGKVSSEDVNDYLRETTGEDFTAKDFRTWAATMQAARLLNQVGPASSTAAANRNYVQVVKQVAQKLGNRPATAKKAYINPAIFASYTDGTLFDAMQSRPQGHTARALRAEELCVVAVILMHLELGKPPKMPEKTAAHSAPAAKHPQRAA